MKFTSLLLRLYPRRWRERYGAELTALLEELPAVGARVAFDVAIGAIREQLRAAFVEVSPKRRQKILFNLVGLGSTLAGVVGSALIALALPDSEMGAILRSTLVLAGVFSSIGATFYLFALQKRSTPGLASGVPRFTPAFACLVVVFVLAASVFANLQVAHAYHLGKKSLLELLMASAARGLPFLPTGLGVAALFWPNKFRDLAPLPPSSSSSLGLGA